MKEARAAVAYGRSKPSPVAGASLYDMLEERQRLEQAKRAIDERGSSDRAADFCRLQAQDIGGLRQFLPVGHSVKIIDFVLRW